MDGYAATGGIRRLEAGRGTKRRCYVTAMTADVMPGVEEKCIASGMDGYLAKPFLMEDLVATLERAWRLAHGGYQAALAASEPSLPSARPAPAPPERADDVDLRILDRLRDLGEKESPPVFRKLVQSFLESSAAKLAALRATALVPDFRALAFSAHGLKGMSLNFGALSMARQCEALQVAAEAERREDLPRLLEGLAAAEARTRVVLESMIGTGTPEAEAASSAPGARGQVG
jgi:HPt (histidine-containing phosphotransfer) domain-containing protein